MSKNKQEKGHTAGIDAAAATPAKERAADAEDLRTSDAADDAADAENAAGESPTAIVSDAPAGDFVGEAETCKHNTLVRMEDSDSRYQCSDCKELLTVTVESFEIKGEFGRPEASAEVQGEIGEIGEHGESGDRGTNAVK